MQKAAFQALRQLAWTVGRYVVAKRVKRSGDCGECGHPWAGHDTEGCQAFTDCPCMMWPYVFDYRLGETESMDGRLFNEHLVDSSGEEDMLTG